MTVSWQEERAERRRRAATMGTRQDPTVLAEIYFWAARYPHGNVKLLLGPDDGQVTCSISLGAEDYVGVGYTLGDALRALRRAIDPAIQR